jgi:hypothetical protein
MKQHGSREPTAVKCAVKGEGNNRDFCVCLAPKNVVYLGHGRSPKVHALKFSLGVSKVGQLVLLTWAT